MIEQPTASYFSYKIEARPTPHNGGCGVYARQSINSGDLLVVWGGQILSAEQLPLLPPVRRQHTIQVEEDLYLAPFHQVAEPADYVNHSCNPNAGLSGQISLVSLRDIRPGEEICFDYAMSDGSPYDEFECACGASTCRGRITGSDWMRPDLWERYEGYFSPYLQRRINQLRRHQQIPQFSLNGVT